MGRSTRDTNFVPTIIGVDSVLFTTPTEVAVKASTHEMLVLSTLNESLPITGHNPSTVLGYTGANLTTVTKTISGVQYRQTLAYTGSVLDSISGWVQL